jgi:hypothetical protein
MSITTSGHVRSAGDERAASAPGFLLRGPLNRDEPELVQFEAIRRPSVGAGALLRGGCVTAVVLAAAFAAYALVADHLPKRGSDAKNEEFLRAQQEPESASPASVEWDRAKQETVGALPREAALDAPRLVRTERFDGDPSVWAGVRKFSPLPPEEVPVLDSPSPEQLPAAAPAVADSGKHTGARHLEPTHAKRNRHGQRLTKDVRRRRMPPGSDSHSDGGGTQVSGAAN